MRSLSRNKYRAIGSRDEAGHYFPSKGEAGRARDLELLQKAGEIEDLVLHPSVEIFPGLSWKLDSAYTTVATGVRVWEDFKGVMTAEVRLKIKIWSYTGPGPLRIVKLDPRSRMNRVDKEYIPKGLKQLAEDLKRCAA